jgi:hypothetical protein
MTTITPPLTFTVAEITRQGYSLAHAEAFVALLAMRPPATKGQPKARPGKRQPKADGARKATANGSREPSRTRAEAGRARGPASARTISRSDYPSIREWAASAGLRCSAKGRIPASVLDAWRERGHREHLVASADPDRARRMFEAR